ncbi:MAG TPA: metallopeptidase TldD-related protein [Gemmatimonadaceae bacterium]|nr:metallopeptidase TldD-related protein [Gemmatimonadaceae bacterium]
MSRRDEPRSLLRQSARYLSREQAQELAQRVLGFATADETRVSIGSGAQGNTRFAVSQISTAGDNFNTTVTIRSVFGRRAGQSTTNALDDASLRRAVATAERLAKLSPEDPEYMPELGPQQYIEARGWSDTTAALEPTQRATAVRAITEPARAEGLVATGYLENNAGSFAVANHNGLFAWSRSTAVALTTTVRTPDGTGSGWAGAAHHDWSRIEPAPLGARAIEKAKLSMNPSAVEPGRYTVVLEPTAVGNLVQLINFALNARNADEGRSFFSKQGGGNKIGEKVVDERVTLVSDPHDPEAYANTFSGEGLPTSRTTWIENGVVRNLAYDRYWAQQKGVDPRPQVGSLRMSGGDTTIEEMIANTQRGILVTRFWYIRPVDPRTILFTGLTRDGTFLIENGRISRAVQNLRFNESPIFMLNNLEAMGRPVRVSASESGSAGFAVVVPPLKVRDFNFTSLSEAV